MGGTSSGHNKNIVHKFFANLKNSHLESASHHHQWYQRHNIPEKLYNKPKVDTIENDELISTNHKRMISEGLVVMDCVNVDAKTEQHPIALIGDPINLNVRQNW